MADSKVSALTLQTTTDGNEFVHVAEPQGTSPETYTSKKTTTEALGHQFRGADVYLSSNLTSQNISGEIPLTFDTEINDTDGFHSTVSNTERFTIPAGRGIKKVRVIFNTRVTSKNSATTLVVLLRHNASGGSNKRTCRTWIYGAGTEASGQAIMQANVADGDYFYAAVVDYVSTGATIQQFETWATLEVIGMDPV